MNLPIRTAVFALSIFTGSVFADDLSGTEQYLCSVQQTNVCRENQGCTASLAEDLNIPQFILVDSKAKELATTKASGENRVTAVDSVSRADGQVILQGVQGGRAYSLLIQESTGHATFASATEGRSVNVFAVCTPATNR